MSIIAEAIKLRNFERNLAKSLLGCLERIDQHEGSNLAELYKETEANRKEDVYSLRCKMVAIYKPLCNIRDTLKKNDVEKIDLKDLKEKMLHIQKNIEALKKDAKENLETLKTEEMTLSEEMLTLENKMSEWEKPVKTNDYFAVPKRISTSATNLCQEAKDFLHFVAKSGGHENGWAREDHTLFIKVRNKSRDEKQLIQSLHKMLPDISVEEIAAHEKWYQKYSELKEKQKNAIQSWRMTKNALSERRNCISAPLSKVKTRFPTTKITKEEIDAWKKKKEALLKNELHMKHLERVKLKGLEEQKRKKNEEIKKEISEWKNLKFFKTKSEKLVLQLAQEHEKTLRASQANKLIKQFQSQDDVYIQRRRSVNVKNRTKSEEKLRPKIDMPRNPERLLKPTKNWLSRLNTDQNAKCDVAVCSIKTVARLGLPEWRKGIC